MLTTKESESIEFKESMPRTKELAKDIVAFANTSLGVQDKTAQVVEINITQKLKDRITDICGSCDPPVEVEEQTLDNKQILIIKVTEGDNKPHFTHGQCFLRFGATSRKLWFIGTIPFTVHQYL